MYRRKILKAMIVTINLVVYLAFPWASTTPATPPTQVTIPTPHSSFTLWPIRWQPLRTGAIYPPIGIPTSAHY